MVSSEASVFVSVELVELAGVAGLGAGAVWAPAVVVFKASRRALIATKAIRGSRLLVAVGFIGLVRCAAAP